MNHGMIGNRGSGRERLKIYKPYASLLKYNEQVLNVLLNWPISSLVGQAHSLPDDIQLYVVYYLVRLLAGESLLKKKDWHICLPVLTS